MRTRGGDSHLPAKERGPGLLPRSWTWSLRTVGHKDTRRFARAAPAPSGAPLCLV